MQPTQPKYTAEQWTASLPALRGMSTKTLDIARAVLVEGKEPIEVANNIGQSRQLVHAAIKRVTAVLERQTVGLVPVMVWLTPRKPSRSSRWPPNMSSQRRPNQGPQRRHLTDRKRPRWRLSVTDSLTAEGFADAYTNRGKGRARLPGLP